MSFIRSSASKCRACIVALILLLSIIMPTCSYYIKKGLVYIIIIAPFSGQPFSYFKCIKLNMYFSCNIKSVFNTKYIFLVHLASY